MLFGVDYVLRSFRWVRCSYTHFQNPADHYLHALRNSASQPFKLFRVRCGSHHGRKAGAEPYRLFRDHEGSSGVGAEERYSRHQQSTERRACTVHRKLQPNGQFEQEVPHRHAQEEPGHEHAARLVACWGDLRGFPFLCEVAYRRAHPERDPQTLRLVSPRPVR